MRAVGEALGLGRTFPEALLKALEGVEAGDALPEIPGLHAYFAAELESIRTAEHELVAGGDVAAAKRFGLPDARIARLLGVSEAEVRARRGLPGRLAVDSCAGEFEARTPYYYLSHEEGDGEEQSAGAIVVLGSGTNRIGQGIEFDYCCVRAAQAFRALGHEVVLVNANPETVSTDYDTCDRLYLEPVTLERVLDVVALEQPLGVVVSLGGQTPLGLAAGLAEAGVPLLGDPLAGDRDGRGPGAIRRAPRRARRPRASLAPCADDRRGARARVRARLPGPRPPLVRARRTRHARRAERRGARARRPCPRRPLPRGSARAGRGRPLRRGGRLGRRDRRARRAGGRPFRRLGLRPPRSFGRRQPERQIRELASTLAGALGVRGLLNLQLALHEGELHVLEANPRASRTVPFVAKATGVPLVDHACRLLLGAQLGELALPSRVVPSRAWAKEAIFPAERFAGAADRGVEMRSTGEVMASGPNSGGRVPPRATGRRPRQAARRRRPAPAGRAPARRVFEQLEPVLELGEPELERLELLTVDEPELARDPLAGLVRQSPIFSTPERSCAPSSSTSWRSAKVDWLSGPVT